MNPLLCLCMFLALDMIVFAIESMLNQQPENFFRDLYLFEPLGDYGNIACFLLRDNNV